MGKLPAINPAQYSSTVIDSLSTLLGELVPPGRRVLDPFAGLGQRFAIMCQGLDLIPLGVEIERGYFLAEATHPCVIQGDSTDLTDLFDDNTFDAACTSPAYPNGMSDDFVAKDLSKRNTYIHRMRSHLGASYSLHPNNAGGFNPRRSPAALQAFYGIHEQVWAEVYRVLKPGAPFLVNTKDPLNVPFQLHTTEQLLAAGFTFVSSHRVEVPGMNHGANQERKLGFEDITVVTKPL